jgi:phospholipid/cholesterol/gamma-HCH transport system ATP-binding protein
MIEVKNVEKSFGDAKVLKGITTTFETGKTNLFRIFWVKNRRV